MSGRRTTEDLVKAVSGMGVEGVELVEQMHLQPHPTPYQLKKLRDLVESLDMKWVCYDQYMNDEYWMKNPTMEESSRQLEEGIINAATLGAKILRFPPGIPYDINSKDGYKKVKKMIEMALPTAKEKNIIIGFEIFTRAENEIQLMEDLGSSHLGLIPDFMAFTQNRPHPFRYPPVPIKEFKSLIPYTVHVHAKCWKFDEQGEDPYSPINILVPQLRDGGYSRYISAEYEGWWLWEVDCVEETKKAVALIKRHL